MQERHQGIGDHVHAKRLLHGHGTGLQLCSYRRKRREHRVDRERTEHCQGGKQRRQATTALCADECHGRIHLICNPCMLLIGTKQVTPRGSIKMEHMERTAQRHNPEQT